MTLPYELVLDCTSCGSFEDYDFEKRTSDGTHIVRCAECGKRHSDANIHFVSPTASYDRDEAGKLLEEPL